MSLSIALREVRDSDLPHFFRHMSDPESNHVAAFTCEDPTDRAYFDAHWAQIRASDAVTRTVLVLGDGVTRGPAVVTPIIQSAPLRELWSTS